MRVCVHRGTQEIGGTCIELESAGQRVLLDLGCPLDLVGADSAGAVPPVSGLRDGQNGPLAILLSHPHQDHVGLVEHTHPSIPVAIGSAAASILDRAASWLDRPLLSSRSLIHWQDRKSVEVGPFRITPYLVDHSAYDAYALLVEGDGQRLFYSGDFRGHGRKRELFERFVAHPPKGIDVLLMEGTVIGRDAEERTFPTEEALEQQLVRRIGSAKGLTLFWTSSQNVDRIVTVFRAARRVGARLILDAFTAEMLAATGNRNIPQADWQAGIGVYVPQWMRRKIVRNKSFDLLRPFARNRVFLDQLRSPAREVLLFRPGMLKEVSESAPLSGAQLIYSNWGGYLAEPSTAAVRDWISSNDLPVHSIHTSGHASIPDLKRFAAALSPRALVPIHSFETSRFTELFANVTPKADGQWWAIPSTRKETTMPTNAKRRSNAELLKLMAAFAELHRTGAEYDRAAMAAMGRYVRINGGGMRPVCISQENPCGALLRQQRDGQQVNIGTLKQAREVPQKLLEASHAPKSNDGKYLWERKREHRVQAWIITRALVAPKDLVRALGLQSEFEELVFVTDELKLGDIRADMVFLGRRGTEWLPVFAEIKAERALTELRKQLQGIVELVNAPETSDAFLCFLHSVTGADAAAINLSGSRKVMIWPQLGENPPRAPTPGLGDVMEVTFDRELFKTKPADFERRIQEVGGHLNLMRLAPSQAGDSARASA